MAALNEGFLFEYRNVKPPFPKMVEPPTKTNRAATCAASGRGEPSTAAAVANSDPSPRTSGGAHLVFHSRPNYRVVPRFSSSGAQAGLW